MKKLIIIGIISITLVNCQKINYEPIKIGAVLPLTGPIAQNGKYYREGLELALSDAIGKHMIPENKVNREDMVLKGFKWLEEYRPLTREDIFVWKVEKKVAAE